MPDEGAPARGVGGACVRFTAELGREICARLAAGESAHALAREPGMPSRRTFGDWAARDPVFGAELAAAKLAGRRARIAATRAADEARIWRARLHKAGGRRGGSALMLTPELAEEICARIAAGETVLAICSEPHMPCTGTLHSWVRLNDEFREQYLRAKDLAADLFHELTLDVALDATEATVRSDRLRIATFNHYAARIEPKKYGLRRLLGPPPELEYAADGEPRPFAIQLIDFVGEPGERDGG